MVTLLLTLDNYLLSVGTEKIANILSLDAENVAVSLKNLAVETNPLTKFSSQHCCASCCVRVNSGLRTDATTPNMDTTHKSL